MNTFTTSLTSSTHQAGEDIQAYLKIGSGPAVVIIHGFGGHKEDWRGVAEALAVNHTVYAVDLLGFGGSSRSCKDLSIATQTEAIKSLLQQEGEASASIVGNSVGGWVAATFATTYPEMTAKLAIIDPAGFAAMFEGEPPVNFFPDDEGQMKQLLSFVIHSDFAHTDEFAAQAFAAFCASGEKSIVPVLWPGLFGSERLEVILPKVQAPALVVWGREDKLFPVALCPYITSLTPGATSVVIDDASHFPQVDQPEALIHHLSAFLGKP